MSPTYIYNKVYALLLAFAVSTVAFAAGENGVAMPNPLEQGHNAKPDTIDISQAAERSKAAAGRPKAVKNSNPANLDSLAAAAIQSLKPRTFKPEPIRSQWVAMVLPGGGQIYNRKYWKLPIIYGGFLGCTYALTWNAQMLRDYSQAYLDIMDTDPNTKSYEKMLPLGYDISGREDKFKEIFKNKKNYYRKYRDMSILAFALVYVIGVIDAYVDAELSTFDISPDLSLQVNPAIINTNPSGPASLNSASSFGVAMTLGF